MNEAPNALQGDRPGPLSGLEVLDLGQIYNGSYATFLMAMAGSDVVKVEPPGGEPLRRRSGDAAINLPFAMLNQHKRDIVLDLKTEAGREVLRALAARADVVLENFAPGVMDRFGLGAEALMAANPRLIYASGSGYGRSGPDRDMLAMDLTVQAYSGIMSITGYENRPPVKAGPALCDFFGGTHLFGAVVAALYERERTGRGRLVEVAMQEASYPALASNLGMMWASGGAAPPRTDNRHGGLAIAPYNVYAASDGHVALMAVREVHWERLMRLVGRADLIGKPGYQENVERAPRMAEIDAIVEAWTRQRSRAEIMALAGEHQIPAAPVRDLPEVTADPHMRGRDMLRTFDHPDLGPVVLPASPLRFHGTRPPPAAANPGLGEHTEAVLRERLALDQAAIAGLRERGAFG